MILILFVCFVFKTRNTDFSNPVARRMGQHNTLKDKHTGEELFTGVYQLLFWINFWGCPGNLKIPLVSLRFGFESYHGIFFPLYFFIHFIKFSSAVEMSSSIQNFSPIKFFFEGVIQYFPFQKKPFQLRQYFNISNW